MTETPALRVDGLRKTFGAGDDAVRAVEDVSVTVESGSIVGLLGPNGAGKTTTIKSILGLVAPDAGTIEVCDVDARARPNEAYDHIGAVLEGARNIYWRLTVRENLAFFAGLGGDDPATLREDHDRLLELLDLQSKADTPVNDLSRGMKQKAALASTLARDVDVVFMDEPTLGLDVEAGLELQSELRRLAHQEDVTIVLSSHDMDVIETVCDRVILLRDGSVFVDESVEELLDVFQLQQYRVTVTPLLDEDRLRAFDGVVDVSVQQEDERLHIDATVSEVDEVYDLLTWLKAEGCSLVDLQSRDPGLEDVFLQLVDGDQDSLSNDGDPPAVDDADPATLESSASGSTDSESSDERRAPQTRAGGN
jgi:ABC-2 type transport system ATP-binding protein